MLKIGDPLLKFESLHEGILLKRYKRFLADVELDNGEIVTAHCANTGPMRGVLNVGGRVRLKYAPSPTRKLSWSWEQAQVLNLKESLCWVGVNTFLPNTLVLMAIKAGCLQKELGLISDIKKEVVYGINRRSRIDLLLYPECQNFDQRNIYIEVKNTTWTQGELALFPDTVTTRGQKHLTELINVIPNSRAVLIPCISRDDTKAFAPGDSADKEYGNLFRIAVKKGVEIIPVCFGFHKDYISWQGIRPFNNYQVLQRA